EYTRIQKDHQTSLHERDDRIKLLQQQLVTALGAARAGQLLQQQLVTALGAARAGQKDHQTSLHERDDRIKLLQQQLVDKTRRAASVAGRKAEERKASDVDRAAIERRCADAENDADRYKAQCQLLQGQLAQQHARGGGGAGLAPHPPGVSPPANVRHAPSNDVSRGELLFGDNDRGSEAGDMSYMGSAMGSHAVYEEGRQLMGWKMKVAELKRSLEAKELAEKRLVFELKVSTEPVFP
ncbi:hypothetical protein T484DRAFT_1850166, partial [Baffinella frigidus]